MWKWMGILTVGVVSACVLTDYANAGTIDGTFVFGANEFAVVQDPNQTWENAQSDVAATLGANWHLAVINQLKMPF